MPPDVHQHPRPPPSCLPTTPCSGRPLRTWLVLADLLDSSAARRFRYRDLSVTLRAPRSSRLPPPPSLCLRRLQARARAASFVSDAASNPLLLALAHRRVPDVSPQPPVCPCTTLMSTLTSMSVACSVIAISFSRKRRWSVAGCGEALPSRAMMSVH
jgi:hypothetical protein